MRAPSTTPVKHPRVRETGGVYRGGRCRLSSEAVVSAFLSGQTPESIAQSFPTATLDQIFGELTFYQAHRPGLDAQMALTESPVDALRRSAREYELSGYLQFRDTRRLDG
jgi:hypothetical protein